MEWGGCFKRVGRRGLEPKSQTAVNHPPTTKKKKKKELLVVLLILWFETDEELSVCFGGGAGVEAEGKL